MRRAVFLDRDGVLIEVVYTNGKSRPPDTIEEVELKENVIENLVDLFSHGYLPIVVTNQPDVARGNQTKDIVDNINEHLFTVLPIYEIEVCYHDTPDNCDCRKPKPGMLLRAAEKWDIDLKRSYMIGDRMTDVKAGWAAGTQSILIDDRMTLTEAVNRILARRDDVINWMRDPTIVNCREIMSGLVDLCEWIAKGRKTETVMYEIGSFAGESAAVFSKYFGTVHCVDPWTSDPNICGLDSRSTFNCEDVQRSFDERSALAGNMVKHVGYSVDEAAKVPDGSLDFVYIDGRHEYEFVKADIAAWWPKVRLGGYIGGHDYHTMSGSDFRVEQAVQEFLAKDVRATDLQLFADTSWIVRKI